VEGSEDYFTPRTPDYFGSWSLTYDFNPKAPEPKQWLAFLKSLWPNDPGSIATLQEWFGYCLTEDTSQQKMLLLVGQRRSGKGTIARILAAMVGEDNIVAPTMNTLPKDFGTEPLIGKPVGIMGDVVISGRVDQAAIVETLLSISGEDAQTVRRKHKPSWTGRLPTRFMMMANDVPRLNNVSGALAGRFIILRILESFFGREDRNLEKKLLAELPGILLWAIEGWRCLNARGRFAPPESSDAEVAEMEELNSPIKVFLADRCIIGDGHEIETGELYRAYCLWCEQEGREHPGDRQLLGRSLRSADPSITTFQKKSLGVHTRYYKGVALGLQSYEPFELN
jgi:putative DNA primase/helicase